MQKDKTISLKMAIDAVHKNYDTILDFTSDGKTISYSIEDILSELPSATDTNVATTDAISRQAAIEAFAPYAEYESNRTNAEWVRRINMVLSALPSAQPVEDIHREKEQAYYCGYEDGAKAARSAQPGWIPCTPETMPEREGRYVCTYTYDGKKEVFMFRFEDGEFMVPWYVETVTAWYKPLDPWEGERK